MIFAIGTVASNVLLTARDEAVAETRRERLILAAAWPVFAIVGAFKDALLPDPRFSILLAVALVNAGAAIGTGFRPGLGMEMVLPEATQADVRLIKRGRRGQITALAAGIAYVFWVYKGDIIVP